MSFADGYMIVTGIVGAGFIAYGIRCDVAERRGGAPQPAKPEEAPLIWVDQPEDEKGPRAI